MSQRSDKVQRSIYPSFEQTKIRSYAFSAEKRIDRNSLSANQIHPICWYIVVLELTDSDHCDVKQCLEREDVISAYLGYDGYLKLKDQIALIPISEPFYTLGRPERELVPGGTAYCMSAGRIPVISDAVYRTLESVGAVGQTAELIYRGFNKKAYDTVQEGYRRFLPSPVFEWHSENDESLKLTEPVPSVFAIKQTKNVVLPEPGIDTRFHIGLSRDSLELVARSIPRLLVVPLIATRNCE